VRGCSETVSINFSQGEFSKASHCAFTSFLAAAGDADVCCHSPTEALNFYSSAARDLVFPLRSKASHNGKTAVSQKKNRASLFSVEPLDYCGIVASGFRQAGSEILTTSYCVSPAAAVELFEETMRTPFDP
jgi:hypothetical protein